MTILHTLDILKQLIKKDNEHLNVIVCRFIYKPLFTKSQRNYYLHHFILADIFIS